mmetsp:Transcript_7587/g.19516  ORF Transcript_7587/g.19516 Transcript_7587/m.19516 type:complete len:218 (+) Transcript_7587:315-968(+)
MRPGDRTRQWHTHFFFTPVDFLPICLALEAPFGAPPFPFPFVPAAFALGFARGLALEPALGLPFPPAFALPPSFVFSSAPPPKPIWRSSSSSLKSKTPSMTASPMLMLDSSRSCMNDPNTASTFASVCPTLTTHTVPDSGAIVTLYIPPLRSTITCESSPLPLTSRRPTAPESPLRSVAPSPSASRRSSSSASTLFRGSLSGIMTVTSPLTPLPVVA